MKLLHEIQQTIKAPKSQFNTHGKYKFRSCSDILEAVKPHLKAAGAFLHMTDEMVEIGNRLYVKAVVTLQHGSERIASAGFAREAEDQKGMNAGQLSCSTSSYARKLALSGLFALDDSHNATDANGKSKKGKKEIIAEAHAKYIKDHTDDIPEHFSIPLEVFTDAIVAVGVKHLKTEEQRAAFKWTLKNVQPFVDELKIAELVKEAV